MCCVSSVIFVAGGVAAGRNPVQGVLPYILQDFENRNPRPALTHKIRLRLLLLLLLYDIQSLCECSASLLILVEEHFNTKC
jgi:hypothetical protein